MKEGEEGYGKGDYVGGYPIDDVLEEYGVLGLLAEIGE